jgi:predicted nuclease of predicted toxin-antitoxin system
VCFLVDANLSPRVAEWLRNEGHDAVHVFDLGLSQAGDHQILQEAARGRQVLVTVDLDFGEILARSEGRTSVVRRLDVALPQAAAALGEGAVVTVGEGSLRVRRLPPGR